MADTKVSALSAASASDGTEVFPVVQGGSSKKMTVLQALKAIFGIGVDNDVTVNQTAGAVSSYPFRAKYLNVVQFGIRYDGVGEFRTGLNVGEGFWVADSAGNTTGYGNTKNVHYLGFGTSPTCSGSSTIAGKDSAFEITVVGTPATITVTFGTAYVTNRPIYVGNGTVSGALTASSTVTQLVLAPASGGNFTNGEVLPVVGMGF